MFVSKLACRVSRETETHKLSSAEPFVTRNFNYLAVTRLETAHEAKVQVNSLTTNSILLHYCYY